MGPCSPFRCYPGTEVVSLLAFMPSRGFPPSASTSLMRCLLSWASAFRPQANPVTSCLLCRVSKNRRIGCPLARVASPPGLFRPPRTAEAEQGSDTLRQHPVALTDQGKLGPLWTVCNPLVQENFGGVDDPVLNSMSCDLFPQADFFSRERKGRGT